MKFVVQNDNTGIPIAHTIPMEDIWKIKCIALVKNNGSVVTSYHDFLFNKYSSSVTSMFNVGVSLGGSMFSGSI